VSEIAELVSNLPESFKSLETPFRVFSFAALNKNYLTIQQSIKNSRIFYAIKVESHPRLLQYLSSLGSGFDVASMGEIMMALEAGAMPQQISYSNPVKKEKDIARAYALGVRLFTADEFDEIDKIALHAPEAKIYIRLTISPDDSGDAVYPMTSKFGAEPRKVKELLHYTYTKGLEPYGISFHVGSQCANKNAWLKPLVQARDILIALHKEGIQLQSINVGGGFPIRYNKEVPDAETICELISQFIQTELNEYHLSIAVEPGRVIVGDACALVTEVILRSDKGGNPWLHLDGGLYQGLSELFWGFEYQPISLDKQGDTLTYTLAGPTCDGLDVYNHGVSLPQTLKAGDRVAFLNTGAYASFLSNTFNGFSPTPVYFV
jgi:ornithine decarboxylase